MDNGIGDEGASALATWESAHVGDLLKAVVPGYPTLSAPLFLHPKVADAAVIAAYGHSSLKDSDPGRMRLTGEWTGE